MAWAEKTSGGRYRGLYRDASGRRHTAPGGPWNRRSDAVREAGVVEDEARRRPGRATPKAGRMTWGTWADQWWDTRRVEPGTQTRDLSRRTTHLEPRWDDVRLDAITRDVVQEWVDELSAGGMGASTVANCYHLLSASLKAAVLAGKLPASPCTSISLPPRPPVDDRFLVWDEVAAIAHFLDERDALLVWLLVGTGIRWGEGVGAHAARFHADAQRLDVHDVWDHRVREVKPYPKGSRTQRPTRKRRSVPTPPWLTEKLTPWLEQHPPTPACGGRHRTGFRCPSGLILPGRAGIPIDYDSWHKTRWLDAVSRAKIGHVRIHDLRHTYASWLLQEGVTLEAVSDLLGHESLETTKRYAHLRDTQWGSVREALARKSATHLPHDDHETRHEDHKSRRSRTSEDA